jgi:hypothetical protein
MNLFTLLRVVAGLTRVAQKAVRQARGKPEPAFDWSGVVFFGVIIVGVVWAIPLIGGPALFRR